MQCEDCGLELVNDHLDEHQGLCCDCFDELWGCPGYKRTRLRPDAGPEEHAKHAEYWDWVAKKRAKRGGPN